MPTAADYHVVRQGDWCLVALKQSWNDDLQNRVLTLVCGQVPAKHPQTLLMTCPDLSFTGHYYLKIFHRARGIGAVKDLVRTSKAFRFWRQGLALSAAGFNVPPTMAVGELRRWGFLQRAFVLTGEVAGQPLPKFLHDLAQTPDRRECFTIKRDGVLRLARIIREFHRLGFVHGDLVASNLFISKAAGGDLSVCFMDNDRTRRYPPYLRQSQWKRNLIQLNRMPLRGITLQDRVRFLRAYLARDEFAPVDRRFARWLEIKTRKRRSECNGADASENFRKLMRWKAGSAAAENL
jgi:hypothetical protein